MATRGDRLVSASPAQARFEAAMARERRRREAKRAGSGLKRSGGPKPSRPKLIPVMHLTAAEEWHSVPWLQQCEVCGTKPAEQAHHAIREQILRRFAYSYGYDSWEQYKWDPRSASSGISDYESLCRTAQQWGLRVELRLVDGRLVELGLSNGYCEDLHGIDDLDRASRILQGYLRTERFA